jgi:hypothetical protein
MVLMASLTALTNGVSNPARTLRFRTSASAVDSESCLRLDISLNLYECHLSSKNSLDDVVGVQEGLREVHPVLVLDLQGNDLRGDGAPEVAMCLSEALANNATLQVCDSRIGLFVVCYMYNICLIICI